MMIPDAQGRIALPAQGGAADRFAYEVEHASAESLLELIRSRAWPSQDRFYKLCPSQIMTIKLMFIRQIIKAGGRIDIDGVRYETDGKTMNATMLTQ